MEEQKKNSSVLVWVVSVVVIALIAYGGYKYFNKNSFDEVESQVVVPKDNNTTTENVVNTPETIVVPELIYKNGVYSSIGDYISPGGSEQIGITLTLKDDVIVDAKAEVKATRPASVKFQGFFSGGFSALVIGKKIDEVKLDKVSGSSLTPKGFNDALAKIKVQAKA